ncbi:MAG: hypothetical protein GW778_01575 [Alphaproteobacteria bacterium]|nr:hypothetical protein [Alphaproteobacteria bacterium]
MTSENNKQAHKKNSPVLEDEERALLVSMKTLINDAVQEFHEFNAALNITIVIGGRQDADDAIIEKQSDILALPSGQDIQNTLRSRISEDNFTSSLAALVKTKHKKMMGLAHDTHHHAVLLINASNHLDIKSFAAEIYGSIWKVLSIIDDEKRGVEECIARNDNFITAHWTEMQTASRNVLADIFAGSLLEAKGQMGALKNIAKSRCLSSLKDLKNYDARLNPFPIMLETAQMVFKDFEASSPNTNPITQALKITSEVIETMDENTILQWQNFIVSAQEMAWSGISIAQLLGAAIYTSDSVYSRTSAYMIADILNTDPAPSLQFQGYNAFADPDTQQRNHKIACLDTIEYIENRQLERRNPNPFFKNAIHGCQYLLQGKPNGFCAPALVAVGLSIEQNPEITKEEVANIFRSETNATPWETILNMHRDIIALKKQDIDVDIKTIIEILRQDEDTRDAAILIKKLSDMDISTTEPNQ